MSARKSVLRVAAALAVALAAAVLVPSSSTAETPSNVITVPVYGSQPYHDQADRLWFWEVPAGLPSGVYLSGRPVCTHLDDGSPLSNDLQGGQYALDISTCSGVVLAGPGSENYTVAYTAAQRHPGFTVYGTLPDSKVSATGTVTSIFALKMTYTAKLAEQLTGIPAAGVTVDFTYNGTVTDAYKVECSAVTNADGVATCSGPLTRIGLPGLSVFARSHPTSNYSSSFASAKISLI